MILEEYIFTSCFLNDIQGLIEQKKQSGYIYDSAKYILIQFDKFCVEKHIDRAIITKELSDTWLSYHADEAKSRRASRMSVLRQLAQYMNSQGSECYIPSKFSAKSYRVPYVMNEREIREFFTVADDYIPKVNADRFSILAEEYKVLFRFIYCCGLRVSEARKLKLEDVDSETNGDYPLFYTVIKGNLSAMSTGNVERILNKYAEKIRPDHPGLPQKLYPHMLRRTRACGLYQNGVELELVSRILGHTSTQTTRIYASPSIEMLKKAMENNSVDVSETAEWLDDEEELARICGIR